MNGQQRQAVIKLLAPHISDANRHLAETVATALVDGPLAPVIEALAVASEAGRATDHYEALDHLFGALDDLDPVWLP